MTQITQHFEQQKQFLTPLALVDLDDTLFQTHRRITPKPDFEVVTTDKAGQPLAFMTAVQQNFVRWLMASCQVIPVTARSVEALLRVHIHFSHGAICSHGGTILNPDLSVNAAWQAHMEQVLSDYQQRQHHLMHALQEAAASLGSIRTWIVQEQDVGLYVVAKQNIDPDAVAQPLFLPELLERLNQKVLDGFYFHLNGNNLAFIPKPVSKANAAQFLLEQRADQDRPIIGFGDSLSDVAFLSQCHWWGIPKQSQLERWVHRNIDQQYQTHGYFGDYPEID